ncbi:MAG: DUF4340 domain-containing protein [Cystobacter sp.]
MNAQQKNLLGLLAVAVVAGGVGYYAYFGVKKLRSEEPPPPPPPGALFPTDAPGVAGQDAGRSAAPIFTWIALEGTEGRTELESRAGVWYLTAPVSARAHRQEVLDLVNELADAKFSSTVTEAPTDEELERFGLKPPRATVSARAYVPDAQGGGAEDPSRQRSVTFQVGIENVFDGSVYVRREGDPRVYLSHGALRVVLFKSPDAWRDPTVFDLDAASLLRIELKSRKSHLLLERATTDKPWMMARPMMMRADAQRVARIFSELKLYKALGYPNPEREALVSRALEKPTIEALLVPKVGEAMRIRLVELTLDGYQQVFARTEGTASPTLAQVDSNTLTVLDPPALDFKTKKVLDAQVGAAEKLIIRPLNGGEPFTLEKTLDTGRWEVVAPVVNHARQFKVASLLGSLEKLEAAAVIATGAKAGTRYGINDASPGVTLLDASGQELARLRIGKPVPEHSQRVWGKGSSEDIYELDTPTLNALPLSLDELMEQDQGVKP